jgi:hypothetical protein
MAALVQRMLMGQQREEPPAPVRPGARGHRPKVAIRAWRVVMDKLILIMKFVEQQLVVQEWFPGSSGLLERPMPLSKEGSETAEDIYAHLIVSAPMLPPLKSKEAPQTSASTCVHPKSALKGGGNKDMSYIYRRMCLSRWENPMTAAEIRSQLKNQKIKGPSSQKKAVEEDSMMMAEPPYFQESSASPSNNMRDMLEEMQQNMEIERAEMRRAQEQMWKELEAQRIEVREKDMLHQRALQAAHLEKERLEEQARVLRQNAVETPTVRCSCGKLAERLRVKKEGPRQGRHFYKCMQRECEFFEWENRAPSPPPSEMSYTLVSSNARGSEASRRRSKSPRTENRRHASEMGDVVTVSDTESLRRR